LGKQVMRKGTSEKLTRLTDKQGPPRGGIEAKLKKEDKMPNKKRKQSESSSDSGMGEVNLNNKEGRREGASTGKQGIKGVYVRCE